MNTQSHARYIKSFSKGQITIPKEFRDEFGLGDEFWLKITSEDGKLVAEPIKEEKKDNTEYLKALLSIKGTWDLRDEIKETRKQIEKRLKKNSL